MKMNGKFGFLHFSINLCLYDDESATNCILLVRFDMICTFRVREKPFSIHRRICKDIPLRIIMGTNTHTHTFARVRFYSIVCMYLGRHVGCVRRVERRIENNPYAVNSIIICRLRVLYHSIEKKISCDFDFIET